METTAKIQALEHLASIKTMVSNLTNSSTALEDAMQVIQDTPLEILVRSAWRNPYTGEEGEAAELQITLRKESPAIRIQAQLEDGQVSGSYIEFVDCDEPWNEPFETPWKILHPYTKEDAQAVREFCCVLGF